MSSKVANTSIVPSTKGRTKTNNLRQHHIYSVDPNESTLSLYQYSHYAPNVAHKLKLDMLKDENAPIGNEDNNRMGGLQDMVVHGVCSRSLRDPFSLLVSVWQEDESTSASLGKRTPSLFLSLNEEYRRPSSLDRLGGATDQLYPGRRIQVEWMNNNSKKKPLEGIISSIDPSHNQEWMVLKDTATGTYSRIRLSDDVFVRYKFDDGETSESKEKDQSRTLQMSNVPLFSNRMRIQYRLQPHTMSWTPQYQIVLSPNLDQLRLMRVSATIRSELKEPVAFARTIKLHAMKREHQNTVRPQMKESSSESSNVRSLSNSNSTVSSNGLFATWKIQLNSDIMPQEEWNTTLFYQRYQKAESFYYATFDPSLATTGKNKIAQTFLSPEHFVKVWNTKPIQPSPFEAESILQPWPSGPAQLYVEDGSNFGEVRWIRDFEMPEKAVGDSVVIRMPSPWSLSYATYVSQVLSRDYADSMIRGFTSTVQLTIFNASPDERTRYPFHIYPMIRDDLLYVSTMDVKLNGAPQLEPLPERKRPLTLDRFKVQIKDQQSIRCEGIPGECTVVIPLTITWNVPLSDASKMIRK